MKKSRVYFLLILCLIISGYIFYSIGFKLGKDSFEENGLIISEKNISYHKYFDSYYGLYYENNQDGAILQIQNPCLVFKKILGQSMLPYYNNETISLIDTCFPAEKLKIGDVILFYYDWDMTTTLHHRIIDINYKKKLIKTKGDNLEDEDNFISFDQVFGKEIGVLNILEDKKVVTMPIDNEGEENITQFCVCSSNSLLKLCYTNRDILMNDSFTIINDLKEENCKDII